MRFLWTLGTTKKGGNLFPPSQLCYSRWCRVRSNGLKSKNHDFSQSQEFSPLNFSHEKAKYHIGSKLFLLAKKDSHTFRIRSYFHTNFEKVDFSHQKWTQTRFVVVDWQHLCVMHALQRQNSNFCSKIGFWWKIAKSLLISALKIKPLKKQ